MSIQNAPIYFGPSALHGQGVFAAAPIAAGSVIEVCPVLLFSKSELPHVRRTMLDDYYFDWGDEGEWYALALGYGSLYNHAYQPNAEYGMDFEANTLEFYALRDIEPGEEIFINYNGDAGNQTTVWFEDPNFKRLQD